MSYLCSFASNGPQRGDGRTQLDQHKEGKQRQTTARLEVVRGKTTQVKDTREEDKSRVNKDTRETRKGKGKRPGQDKTSQGKAGQRKQV